MALSTLLLPSSSTSKTATVTDTSDRRRHHHHQNHTKRKKKPPPPPPLSPMPRTPPPGSGAGHRAMATVTASKKSTKQQALVAAKSGHHHPKKAAAAPTMTPSRAAPAPASASAAPVSSWEQLKSLLSCRSATAAARVHDPAAPSALSRLRSHGAGACGASLCAIRDVVDAASSVGAASSAAASVDRDTTPLTRSSRRAHRAASSSSGGGHHPALRGLSGCYECRAINVEPMSRRYPRPRELCACSQCGEVFTKAESLEHHQAIRHAVSELGPEDSGRNIVEIIFKSSWQKRDRPICHIDRILKVHNAPRTVARFEAYRDAVRTRCRATAARAAADGNELLRFHSAGLACALGLNGATSLCASSSSAAADGGACGVCAAIRHGLAPWVGAHPLGVRTTASSGRAHDCGAAQAQQGCRAMLVCRVIAGRVRRRNADDADDAAAAEEGAFDSVAGDEAASSVYGNLEELFVANPRAILPCFVVIYRVAE
ncbi:uncharacterized protein LOC102720423 [Oryza brachyantha]|uniref:uncharacterized protein LOC102720423 n=1 Tax=Oryza brachyantha TaxID=4533 RepID=UPI001ADC8FDE|nr:uncharacterized protein LOC102720423 [Oryza brachyantha]